MSQIQVRDEAGRGLPRINIRISLGTQQSDRAVFDVFTDLVGNATWPIPYWPTGTYTFWINDQNVDPRYMATSQLVTTTEDQVIILTTTGAAAPAGPLARVVRIEGHRIVNERGEKLAGRGASAFLLYKKFLDGEDIRPQLDQWQSLGCHLIRLMGSFESLGGFNPKLYGDGYYDRIPDFMATIAEAGIYGLWTACAAIGGMMSPDEALHHTQRTAEQLLKTVNPIFSYVNEQGQHNNSVDRQRFKNDVDTGWMLYDTGSFGQDLPCEPPFGTHAVLHTQRTYSHNVRDCCVLDNPNYERDHLQVGLDEPARFGVTDDPGGNGSVEQAADAAGTAHTALFFVFHSLQGEKAEVLRDNTLDCANAAFAAMRGR